MTVGSDLLGHRQCVNAVIGTDVDDLLAGLKQFPDESQFVFEEVLLLAQHVRTDQFNRVRNGYLTPSSRATLSFRPSSEVLLITA